MADSFHFSVNIISRGKGKSAVASASYISGEKIKNEWDGVTHDYTKKQGVKEIDQHIRARTLIEKISGKKNLREKEWLGEIKNLDDKIPAGAKLY